jgi:hypothetical protein
MKKTLLFIFLFSSLTSIAQVGGAGTYSFLRLPMSARAEGLGGMANAVLDNDVSLALQNPAMINPLMHKRLAVSYVNYFAGINMGFAGYAHDFKKIGTFYGGISFVNYGSITQAEENGDITGKFSAGDYAINIGGSRSFFNGLFNVGVTTKLIFSQMAGYNSAGLALDMGAAYVSKNKRFIVTAVMKNVGTQFKTYTTGNRESLPFEIQLGASKEFEKIPLRFSIVAHNLQTPDMTFIDPSRVNETDITGQPINQNVSIPNKILRHFVIGAELFPFRRIISARIGYNFMRRQEMKAQSKGGTIGLCWGLGVRINRFELTYSRAAYHLTGSPNTLSLNVNLGVMPPKPPKKEKSPKK